MNTKYRVIMPTIVLTFLVGCSDASSDGPKFDSSFSENEMTGFFMGLSKSDMKIFRKAGDFTEPMEYFYEYINPTDKAEEEYQAIIFQFWHGKTVQEMHDDTKELSQDFIDRMFN